MGFSGETQQKINQFAKEQAQYYLDDAEMTYIEKLRRKTGQTKQKIGRKLARFKRDSDRALEAQSDMILYMSDYMNDLMSKGLSERDAFEKARAELASSGDSDLRDCLNERFRQYYENRDPAEYEAAGLFYAGFTTIGIVAGALAGYILSGGRPEFLDGGWIDTLIGAGAGVLAGSGLGMVGHAVKVGKKR